MEELPVLYCFKLDEETGLITKHEIPEYHIDIHSYTKNKTYVFKYQFGKSISKHYIPEDKLDKFSGTKLYTFNPDFKTAYEIINDTIAKKIIEAQAKVEKYSALFVKTKINVV